MSLLAYCYYNTQDFLMAAECYGKLTDLYPQHSDYKLYHAQSLYNAFMFPEAVAALALVRALLRVHAISQQGSLCSPPI
jgi:tetratricopeptide repeat protein 30